MFVFPVQASSIIHSATTTRKFNHNRAFTLIELLVVVAIISVLMSILLPSLSAARKNSRRVACMSNVRQVCLATYMYTETHDRYYPTLLRNSGVGMDYMVSWGSYATKYSDTSEWIGFGLMVDQQFIPSWKSLLCPGRGNAEWPNTKVIAYMTGATTTAPSVSYVFHGYALNSSDHVKEQMSQWRRNDAAGTIALTSDIFANYYQTVRSHENGLNVGRTDGSGVFLTDKTPTPFLSNSTLFNAISSYGPGQTNMSAGQHVNFFEQVFSK